VAFNAPIAHQNRPRRSTASLWCRKGAFNAPIANHVERRPVPVETHGRDLRVSAPATMLQECIES
jgi:hypothetical protein